MGLVTLGVDIGQRRDPTAIAVVHAEPRETRPGVWDVHHVVQYLAREPLGTPYPRIVERLEEVLARVVQRINEREAEAALHHTDPSLLPRLGRVYLDATGVGTPVLDALRAAPSVQALGIPVVAVFFTHGDRRSVEQGQVSLGKAWAVSRLQVLLQSRRLHLPRTAEADACGQELLDFEIRIDQNANDRYGAFKTGSHDDLVTALGLATQEDGPHYDRGRDAALLRSMQGSDLDEDALTERDLAQITW